MKDINYYKTHVKKSNPFVYYLLLVIIKNYVFFRARVKVDKSNIKQLKKPFILVFNHPSKLDFSYTFFPLWRMRMNAMVAHAYFCNKYVAWLFHQLGGFPKYLYSADISAIKNAIKVIRWGGGLGVSPEGRLSPHGAMESIIPATAKLIKKMNVDVYLNLIKGGYFALPKWSKTIRRGRVDITYALLFKKEDIAQLSEDEINKRLYEALYYDDFAWQEEKQIAYRGRKFAEGVEHILYICPVCKSHYTIETKKSHLKCCACSFEATLNPYYQFESKHNIPKNIRDWYLFQKDYEAQQDFSNFALHSQVTLKMPDDKGKGFVEVGMGEVIFTPSGLTYTGTIKGMVETVIFKIENTPAILFGVKEDFEIYKDNTLYYFVPENIRECVRYSILAEIFYNRYLLSLRK